MLQINLSPHELMTHPKTTKYVVLKGFHYLIIIQELIIMTVERITFTIVGILIMATVGAYLTTQNTDFLYALIFIGFMIFQAPFTKFCPLPLILKLMGIKTGSVFG
jgi:hypothetical protein